VVIFPFELQCIWLCPLTTLEFVAPAVSTMNLVQMEFLLCEWSSFGLSALLFRLGWQRRLFLWEIFYV